MEKTIYLDNAATTPVRPEVVDAMTPYFIKYYGNPSGIYPLAQESRKAVTAARNTISASIGAPIYDSDEKFDVYFTGSGTEADNWAIIATALAYADKGRHIITSSIEHHAVLHTCQFLEKQGWEVTYIKVNEEGIVDLEELKSAVRDDTVLITIMFANNEIGSVQPVKEIGEIAKEHGIPFHTDAVQAYCHLPINVDLQNIDMMSASAHKLYGPKGAGFLYIRKGLKLRNFIHGGAQERNRRAGTENVPAIVGFEKAVQLAQDDYKTRTDHEIELRDRMIKLIEKEIDHVHLNGSRTERLPGNVNFSFEFVESELILLDLMQHGICASSGSACTTKSLDPSHVLLACGIEHGLANGSVRFTLGRQTTKHDIDFTVKCLKEIIAKRREMSPLYEDYLKKNDAEKTKKKKLFTDKGDR